MICHVAVIKQKKVRTVNLFVCLITTHRSVELLATASVAQPPVTVTTAFVVRVLQASRCRVP